MNPHEYQTPKTFNFLASLINGNFPYRTRTLLDFDSLSLKAFNFLASLINGNSSGAA